MSNRAKGEGCYWFNEKASRWIWRIQLKDANGSPKIYTLSGKNRPELKLRVAEFLKNYEQTKHPGHVTLAEYSENWLQAIRPTISPATMDFYFRLTKIYLIPEFGRKKMKDITPLQLQNFLNQLSNRHQIINKEKLLSGNTINGIRRTAIALFSSAVDNQIINYNPAAKTKPQKTQPREIIALEEHQLKKFLQIAGTQDFIYIDVKKSKASGKVEYYPKEYEFPEDDGMIYNRHCFLTQITLLAFTGLRISEALALKWDSIDFKASELTVRYSLSGGKILKAPKTSKSIRKILLDGETCKMLSNWQTEQQAFADKFHGNYNNPEGLIFTNVFGGFVSTRNQRASYWDKLVTAAQLPQKFTYHSLRHTHATLLLKAGVDIRTVSERLGHASAVMTLNVYAHALKSMQQSAVKAITNWRS